jgi:hypothetical protein
MFASVSGAITGAAGDALISMRRLRQQQALVTSRLVAQEPGISSIEVIWRAAAAAWVDR